VRKEERSREQRRSRDVEIREERDSEYFAGGWWMGKDRSVWSRGILKGG
jgi:hypothetical protein